MEEIRLPGGVWRYDPDELLGPPGGFGSVFKGWSADDAPVAVKRLKVEAKAAAHREITLAEFLAGRELKHVVPVMDAGMDAASELYFVVMPRADGSLQDTLDEGTLYA